MNSLAVPRCALEGIEDQPADRIALLGGYLPSGLTIEIEDLDAPKHFVAAVAKLANRQQFLGIELVANLTDDFFEDILLRHESLCYAKFVLHESDMTECPLHLGQQPENRLSFAQVLGRLECRIDGASVEYLAHWITPEPEPRRYDTRFFAAKVPEGATPIVDVREMTDAVWITPDAALVRSDEGTLPMIFPTIKTLEQLRDYETTDDALASLAGLSVRTVLPTLVITETGITLEVDEDEEYDE